MAAREMGELSIEDALSLCELLAELDPERYERASVALASTVHGRAAATLAEVALAASVLAEVLHGNGNV
jgi:hypothetical protein